jgi:hypothetical protein
MKAEHRHELKTNDLAIWLGNLPTLVNQNLRVIIYVSVVILLVLGSSIYYRYQKTVVAVRDQETMTAMISQLPQQKAYIAQKQSQGDDSAFTLLSLIDGLDTIAKNSSNDNAIALALIKQAEVLRTELQMRFGTPSQQDIATPIGKAKDLYTKALEKYLKKTPNPTLEAIAKIGLGLCEEELGNADAAKKLYQEVATGVAYEGTAPVEAAKQRLLAMDSFTEKIALKSMPKAKMQMQPPVVREPNAPAQN